MTRKRRRRRPSAARRRYETRRNALLGGGVLALLVLTTFWAEIWPYAAGAALTGAVGGVAWWLWRTDRLVRGRDARWREAEAIGAGQRSLAEVDAMSWQEFERYVADLCRRDGCTDVEVSGRSGDLGADVTGTLPDGRRLVVQCKHYAPHRYVPSGDMQKFVGTAWLHHKADVAVFAATCPFSEAALALAVQHDILAVHRDLLGLWNTGTPLPALLPLNGTGQGDRTHRKRWKDTYGT
ncbi:restriction endonuclease [Streptomyces niveus]|uniref:restriction endonuclease n=1 Tax=Streptomyces niveus TaxID=193462 RepID=UPI00099038A0|nr:restriction endonuclease [Streptomyces niveus]